MTAVPHGAERTTIKAGLRDGFAVRSHVVALKLFAVDVVVSLEMGREDICGQCFVFLFALMPHWALWLLVGSLSKFWQLKPVLGTTAEATHGDYCLLEDLFFLAIAILCFRTLPKRTFFQSQLFSTLSPSSL
ncbi:hypothetical protein HDK90DRAFT_110017 [Phyllosticta capitalensis]|uniref:Uncharacterized protein n=1 Tax=Phyllosticta capitalensis TaxID=121624 RepID=A0ABR1YB76_9PEZI